MSAATRTFRPMRRAARDDRPLADDGDARVQAVRLLLVRPVVVRPVAHDGALADHDLLVEDRAVDDRARADDGVEHHDRIAHDRADLDAHAWREHRVHDGPVDHAAVADEAAVDLGGRPDLGRGPFLGAGVDDPVLVVEVELGVVGEERHVGLPERLDRPDVLPVAHVAIAEDARPGVEHRRDHVRPEVDAVLRQPAPERLLREDVDAHRGQVALGLLGLLLPFGHAVVLVEREDAHARRLRERHPADRDGHVGPLAPMGGHERLVVHLVDVVAGQDDDRVRVVVLDDVEVAQHRVRRAAVPLRHPAARDVRLEQLHAAAVAVEVPRAAEADVVVERARVVLGQDHHVVDVGVDAVGQREIDDPVLAPERDRRLGPLLGQDREALALTAGEDHRHGPFHGPSSLQDPWSGPCARPRSMLARAARTNVNAALPAGERPVSAAAHTGRCRRTNAASAASRTALPAHERPVATGVSHRALPAHERPVATGIGHDLHPENVMAVCRPIRPAGDSGTASPAAGPSVDPALLGAILAAKPPPIGHNVLAVVVMADRPGRSASVPGPPAPSRPDEREHRVARR